MGLLRPTTLGSSSGCFLAQHSPCTLLESLSFPQIHPYGTIRRCNSSGPEAVKSPIPKERVLATRSQCQKLASVMVRPGARPLILQRVGLTGHVIQKSRFSSWFRNSKRILPLSTRVKSLPKLAALQSTSLRQNHLRRVPSLSKNSFHLIISGDIFRMLQCQNHWPSLVSLSVQTMLTVGFFPSVPFWVAWGGADVSLAGCDRSRISFKD